jgi:hypothetical protein
MRTRNVFRNALTTLIISVVGTVALAASPPTTTPAGPSKDTREKMAVLHEQMAACLRSDKSIADCRDEMRKTCQTTVGAQGCPMMGMGHHGGRRAPSEPSGQK